MGLAFPVTVKPSNHSITHEQGVYWSESWKIRCNLAAAVAATAAVDDLGVEAVAVRASL